MRTKFRIGCLVFMCLCLVLRCDAFNYNKYVKVDKGGETNNLEYKNTSDISHVTDKGRGFLLHGGLFSLGKVLNFFPVGGERECKPSSYTIAGAGICLNPYDCRQRDGKASGDCAQGLGVCCVFEVSCGATVQNNLTYFMSPGFPELWSGEENCTIHIEKTHAGIMQLRIDFVHFTIGQPNRTTGECNEDAMILGEGTNNLTLCGQNHGQHVYYTLPSTSETREAGELPGTKSTPLVIRMRGTEKPRLWLLRLAQMPLAYSSPHNCLQYHTENNGTIMTFNFASNGRHLSSQEYRVCVRRGAGRCAVRYSPCHQNSFRIGAGGGGGLTESPAPPPPVSDLTDEEEGSGADPMITDTSTPTPGILSRRSWGWSPYHQHHALWYGAGGAGHGRRRCGDRLTIPCDNEYLVTAIGYAGYYKSAGAMPVCDPHRCGSSLCGSWPCRVESSVTPFAVSVHFGPPAPKPDPDMNLGACLKYEQLPCD